MKYLTLNKNVYIVTGASRAAIYDINKGQMYSINKATQEFIDKLVTSDVRSVNNLSEKEAEIFNELLDNELLLYVVSKPKINNIK